MLDKKDKELLRLLQYDCTQCVHDLAAAVDLTPNPCWKRIKRLEDEGRRVSAWGPPQWNGSSARPHRQGRGTLPEG